VNKIALRVTQNEYNLPYVELLNEVDKCTLYESRQKSIALETFKSKKGYNPSYMNSLFTISDSPYETRGGVKLVQSKVDTIRFGINSFSYQGAKIWNTLPSDVKDADSLHTAKGLIYKWKGFTCKCGCCIKCNMLNI